MAVNIIQRQLGHTDLGTTSTYLQGIDPSEIINAVRSRRQPTISATAGLTLRSLSLANRPPAAPAGGDAESRTSAATPSAVSPDAAASRAPLGRRRCGSLVGSPELSSPEMVDSELSPSAGAFEEVRRTPYTLRPGEGDVRVELITAPRSRSAQRDMCLVHPVAASLCLLGRPGRGWARRRLCRGMCQRSGLGPRCPG